MQSLSHQFLTFCRSKPADEAYNFYALSYNSKGCAVTQFTATLGHKAGSDLWCNLHDRVEDLVVNRPWTFGALADRLEAALA